ncbi:Ig-like domain-containing protein [Streptomyces albipurpureus]|uniref:Ig-like domain-containing protein n=1 Tax=Streptomyces albipurpureus TaxID=2897419 RepID=A0ABT0UI92_9ACTN|nr:Ig-like domain-containing protein [Streptomyces sp. CWNU-1]MCM2387800.1 Ig-like domain-containing protein [Streptomyces sp. CWNU-1]
MASDLSPEGQEQLKKLEEELRKKEQNAQKDQELKEVKEQLKQQQQELKEIKELLKALTENNDKKTLPKQEDGSSGGSKSLRRPMLKAETVGGHAIGGGLAHGEFAARLTDPTNNKPIAGRLIRFVGDGGQEICQQTTDADGWARVDSGSRILDPLLVGHVLGNGYKAKFEGDEEWLATEARASASAGV